MRRSMLYGVFVGVSPGKRWCMTRNKRAALRLAKDDQGEVRAMFLPRERMAWDAPTFYTMSDRIYIHPNREAKAGVQDEGSGAGAVQP